MKRKLFLYGEIGCGKSTMIKNALGSSIEDADGFTTEKILQDGRLAGFSLNDRCFLSFDKALKTEDHVFSEYVPKLLTEALKGPFTILDEIGGIELLVPEFSRALDKFLCSDIPCIGVMKTKQSARELSEKTGLDEHYFAEYERLLERMQMDPDIEVLSTTGWQDEQAIRQVEEWVNAYAKK